MTYDSDPHAEWVAKFSKHLFLGCLAFCIVVLLWELI